MISTHDLSKTFHDAHALKEVNLTLQTGIVALVGRNGSGKSTLLSLLAGLSVESEGEMSLRGRRLSGNRSELRAATSLLPQDLSLDPATSPALLIRHLLRIRRRSTEAVDFWLGEMGLSHVAHRPLKTLSSGMRQRAALAYVFAADTPALLLDEPTQWLDPWERLSLASHLALAARDKVIVFSTHNISDVEAIASRVVVLDGGAIVFDGSPEALRALAPSVYIAEVDETRLPGITRTAAVAAVAQPSTGVYRVRLLGGDPPAGAKEAEPSLGDAYMALTRRGDAGA